MAFVGIQLLVWSFTGLYMVVMNIHFIHGESLVSKTKPNIETQDIEYSIEQLIEQYPHARNISLISQLNNPIYKFIPNENTQNYNLVNAKTGAELALITKSKAQKIAQGEYALPHDITQITLLTSQAPAELSPRYLPVWRIEFDHFSSPTFYISQHTGELVTKRHTYWRLFDWMWRFHITDYDDGENVSNWFLLLLALTAIISAFAGAILTYFRVFKAGDTASAANL